MLDNFLNRQVRNRGKVGKRRGRLCCEFVCIGTARANKRTKTQQRPRKYCDSEAGVQDRLPGQTAKFEDSIHDDMDLREMELSVVEGPPHDSKGDASNSNWEARRWEPGG